MSAFFSRALTISSARGALRLRVTDFLLALNWWKYQGSSSGWPGRCRRPGSPVIGFSILTTSAPSQASASVQDGPASNCVKSTTRTPSRQSSSTPFIARSPPEKQAGIIARDATAGKPAVPGLAISPKDKLDIQLAEYEIHHARNRSLRSQKQALRPARTRRARGGNLDHPSRQACCQACSGRNDPKSRTCARVGEPHSRTQPVGHSRWAEAQGPDCRGASLTLVLDSSVTLAWFFRDEQTDAVREVLGTIGRSGAVVPSLWRIEVANALQMAIRRGRIDAGYRDASIADLAIMDIVVDAESDRQVWSTTLNLADRFRLTLYDAVYLELAHRLALPLASLDRQLRRAASPLGVTLLGA